MVDNINMKFESKTQYWLSCEYRNGENFISTAVDKTRNMEHSGKCRNIPEHPGTSRNIPEHEKIFKILKK